MRIFKLVSLLCLTPAVYSWGELGHRTVAYLAEKYLTANASRLVDTLLTNDRGWDISDGAIWADAIRHRDGFTHTAGWHFIDARDDPPNYCNVTYDRDCEEGHGCIVSAIANFTSRINNASLSNADQKEALMFLLHFIGDIHQPLHTEHLERGGNGIRVCFDARCGERVNLHGVWDREIPHKLRGLNSTDNGAAIKIAASEWAEDLYHENAHGETRTGECGNIEDAQTCALKWATEANAWICTYVLEKGRPWLEENDLGGEYYDDAALIVNSLVGHAGLRLGTWLNALAAARTDREVLLEQGDERSEV